MINYSNFANETNSFVDEEIDVQMPIEEAELYDRPSDEADDFEGDILEGKVSASKIYLREEPTKESDALKVLERGDELLIDIAKSVDDWYSVCTVTGVEGYVMKNLVNVE